MVFSDLFFLFAFLPAFALCYLLLKRHRNAVLVLFSLIFYAWGEPVYVLLMLASVVVNYFVGIGIEKRGKPALVIGLVFNLGILFVFKYAGFLVENIEVLLGKTFHLSPRPAYRHQFLHLPIHFLLD